MEVPATTPTTVIVSYVLVTVFYVSSVLSSIVISSMWVTGSGRCAGCLLVNQQYVIFLLLSQESCDLLFWHSLTIFLLFSCITPHKTSILAQPVINLQLSSVLL